MAPIGSLSFSLHYTSNHCTITMTTTCDVKVLNRSRDCVCVVVCVNDDGNLLGIHNRLLLLTTDSLFAQRLSRAWVASVVNDHYPKCTTVRKISNTVVVL